MDDEDVESTGTTMDALTAAAPRLPASAELMPGQRLGRYVIIDVLGAGAMGMVYRASDPELSRHVAIKILRRRKRRDDASSGHWSHRLLAEAQAMAQLQHPNVIAVYDVGAVGDDVFIAMELIAGRTMDRWLSRQRTVGEILHAFIDAAHGLAAAHAAGIVHRDFKPSNVMIAEDGRVRVLDFGVARATGDSLIDSSPQAESEEPRKGGFAGTPSYMAPEQATGNQASPASDQFAFCVSLYEALWGRRPFPPRRVAEVKSYVAERRPMDPPQRSDVPPWLRRVVMRGLAADPAARYPSMDALIDDAARSAAQARRRRLLLAVGALVFAALVTTGGALGWRAHSLHEAARAREAAAAQRLQAMEQRVTELVASDRLADADSAFLAYARLDENRGTDALARAWLDRAQLVQEQGRHADELDAWASAWRQAPAPGRQVEAVLGLAGAFVRRWDWDRLDAALDLLDGDLKPHVAVTQVTPLRIASLLARRNLAAASRLMNGYSMLDGAGGALDAGPAIAAMSHAAPTALAGDIVVPARVNGGPALLLLLPGAERIAAVRVDRAFTPLWTARVRHSNGEVLKFWALEPSPGELYLLVLQRAEGSPHAVLYRVQDGALVPEYDWVENDIGAARVVDVDGDGAPEILVGTGPYTRNVLALRRTPTGWKSIEYYPDLGKGLSDVIALGSWDLDGDGKPEIVLGVGPWHAYDVRVLQAGASGLRTLARQRLGAVTAVERVLTGQGPRLAVTKADMWPSKLVFPDGEHMGGQLGIHLFAWQGGALVPSGLVPAPRPETGERALGVGQLIVADVDGDGREDMIAALSSGTFPRHALVARQRPDGSFAAALVGGVEVLAAIELDGDKGAELLARFSDDQRLWVLGMGDTPTPTLPGRLVPRAAGAMPGAARRDPAIARMWSRADDLVAMGLGAQAAQVFDEVAELGGSTGAMARRRAATLWEAEGELARAADRFEASGKTDAGAALHAAELRSRLHDFDAAEPLAASVVSRADASAELRLSAGALTSELSPRTAASVIETTFATPLAAAWRILAPEVLHRDLNTRALSVDAFGDLDDLAQLPVVVDADWIRISVELEVSRTEWGSGLEVTLHAPGKVHADGLGVGVAAFGGGNLLERRIGCIVPGDGTIVGTVDAIDSVSTPGSYVISVDYVPSRAEAWCTISVPGGAVLRRRRLAVHGTLAAGGRLLAIRRGGEQALTNPVWAQARIKRISTRGLHISDDGNTGDAATAATQAGHHMLIDGDAAGALAAYDAAPLAARQDPAWVIGRAQALDALGRRPEALAELRAAMRRRPPEPPVEAEASVAQARGNDIEYRLWHLVRVHDRVFAPLAQAVLGAAYVPRFVAVWQDVLSMHLDDQRMQELVTSTNLDAEAVKSGTRQEGFAAVVLLTHRGDAWWRLGHFGAARADLERALALGAPLIGTPPPRASTQPLVEYLADAHVLLAAILVASGDEAGALAHGRAALAITPHPESTRDNIALHPGLAAMRGHAGWDELLPQ